MTKFPKSETESRGDAAGLHDWSLLCDGCRTEYAVGPMFFGCPNCSRSETLRPLELQFRPAQTPTPPSARRGRGIARFLDVLPGGSAADFISLGEGDTPLIRSRVIGPALGLRRLYFKNDAVSPTWSFKDRYVAISINMARHFGFRRIAVSSTGNLGVSTAAYCARAALDCLFIAEAGTPQPVIDQARAHGAVVALAEAGSRQRLLEALVMEGGWFPVGLFLPRRVNNPFGVEGYKTFAYELVDELGEAPGTVIFPCARGNALYGAWKGFIEAARWGWSSALPTMIASQPAGADSLAAAIRIGAEQPPELPRFNSIAVSTSEAVSSPHALQAIRSSGGTAVSVSEESIAAAQLALAREGLYVEASSAMTVACLGSALEAGSISGDRSIVCVLTGAGLKWQLPAASSLPPAIEASSDPATLKAALLARGWPSGKGP